MLYKIEVMQHTIHHIAVLINYTVIQIQIQIVSLLICRLNSYYAK